MGTCRSKPQESLTTTTTNGNGPSPLLSADGSTKGQENSPINIHKITNTTPPTPQNWKDDDATTGALMQAVLPLVLPIVRQIVSNQWVTERMVLKDEVLVEHYNAERDEPTILQDLQLDLDSVTLLGYETLQRDVQAMPEFEWPVQEELAQLQSSSTSSNKCREWIAMDITNVQLQLVLGPGIELTVPVEGPMGMNAMLEMGTNATTIPDAWCQIVIPKLRLWYLTKSQRKLYVAMLSRPRLWPHIQINADRGNGDFFSTEFTQDGTLDDVVESVLCGLGPSELTEPNNDNTDNNKENNDENGGSWIGRALGRAISKAAGVGNGRPLEIDLNETIQTNLDSLLGKPRSVDVLETELEALQEELKRAKKEQQSQPAAATAPKIGTNASQDTQTEENLLNPRELVKNMEDIHKEDPATTTTTGLFCCGLGST